MTSTMTPTPLRQPGERAAKRPAKAKKLFAEFGSICSSHEDYIWRRVAGNIVGTARGGASFSTYYVCDQGRESQADAIVTSAIGPILDKMVAEGKLKTWGWNEHIVGGDFRHVCRVPVGTSWGLRSGGWTRPGSGL